MEDYRGEKKLYLYLRDEEYGKRLVRYISGRRHPGLRAMRMTDREAFWESRGHSESKNEVWVTDDETGQAADPLGGKELILLGTRNDPERGFVSVCQEARAIDQEITRFIGLDVKTEEEVKPLAGVYAVYAPEGLPGVVACEVLAEEFSQYGSCLYVPLREFPVETSYSEEGSSVYMEEGDTGTGFHLGDVLFRIEEKSSFLSAVEKSGIHKGTYWELPGISHFRDLWDMSEQELHLFTERLGESGYDYVVIGMDALREVFAVAEASMYFYMVSTEEGGQSVSQRWESYTSVEGKNELLMKTCFVTIPNGWERWRIPGAGEDAKDFAKMMWRGEDGR